MTHDYKKTLDWFNEANWDERCPAVKATRAALQLAQEAEQLRKRLAELETLLAQANKTIKWYERTEATND